MHRCALVSVFGIYHRTHTGDNSEGRLSIDGDLYTLGRILLWVDGRLLDGENAIPFDLSHLVRRLVIGPVVRLALCAEGDGVGTGLLEGDNTGAGRARGTVCRDDVRRGVRVRGGAGDGVRATVLERAAHGEDDAERHRRGEDGSHARHNRAHRVDLAGRGDDKPEDHVNHVDEPDGGIEVQAVTEHEFPVRNRLHLQGLERAGESEGERGGIEDGRRDPIDADPGVLGLGNAALALE